MPQTEADIKRDTVRHVVTSLLEIGEQDFYIQAYMLVYFSQLEVGYNLDCNLLQSQAGNFGFAPFSPSTFPSHGMYTLAVTPRAYNQIHCIVLHQLIS